MTGFGDPSFYSDRWADVYDERHGWLDGQGMHLWPIALRYSWPGELDLMAGQAGLRLQERYGDWDRRPFGAACDRHVSVYQRG